MTEFLAYGLLYFAYAMFVVLGFVAVVLQFLKAKHEEERAYLFDDTAPVAGNVVRFRRRDVAS